MSLRWDKHVDLWRGIISIQQSKTLRIKSVPINAASSEALRLLEENRYGDFVFLWPWGKRIGRTTVYDAFKRACADAKIVDFRFHDLRHTFASHLVMAGVDLVTVKELMGHAGIAMTVRYSHLVPEHKLQALAKLGERLEGGKQESAAPTAVVSDELKDEIEKNLAQNWNKTGTFTW